MKILAIQNRMGIGDMVIFLPFIEAISKKFNTPISILVKENSKAIQFLSDNKNIDKIIILDRDNKKKDGYHDGVIGSYNLIKDLKKINFDKVFIFNSSLRFNLISKFAGIKEIYQYPLFKKKNQHLINTAKEFIKKKIDIEVESNPKIELSKDSIMKTKFKYKIDNEQINILMGVGGSGPTKRIPSKIFIDFMRIVNQNYDCKFFLATGKNYEEQKILTEILKVKFNHECISLDNLDLKEILPIIKNCNISICNDSSFSHLSSALGIKTIVLLSDTPLLYGSYSPQMYPIIPDGEKTVTHNTLGKNKINPEKIFQQFQKILN
ncbi:MAG: lipopolysaccharide heptosyltransferase family protein [Candidatus Pelagibacter sp. TMED106]|nr:MAG: lipopolysaccharide heptosyltransferase family protein [Candidatus Pelagibacter sp. TMED106]|tara:strand:+ start:2957 stop:3922 length:966 start_codon:yes stop_codon:yes gene_type:complete